jgi:hypothetical protein
MVADEVLQWMCVMTNQKEFNAGSIIVWETGGRFALGKSFLNHLALTRKVFPEFQWRCDDKSQRGLNVVPLWLRNTGAFASAFREKLHKNDSHLHSGGNQWVLS